MQYVFFHPPQEKGKDLLVQLLQRQRALFLRFCRRLGIPRRQNGLAIGFVKLPLSAQKARHKKIKQGPQLQRIVLNWRSTQNKSVVGLQCLDSLQDEGKMYEARE